MKTPLGLPVVKLFNGCAIMADKFSSESSADIDLQEQHGNEKCHNTNFKHTNQKHISKLEKTILQKEQNILKLLKSLQDSLKDVEKNPSKHVFT